MTTRSYCIAVISILVLIAGIGFFTAPKYLANVPDIHLHFIDGRKVELKSLLGQPILVTFWSTTCATCINEMPHLVALYNEFHQDGLEIIGIAMPYDPPNRVVALSEKRKLPYPVALDIAGLATKRFGNVSVTPTSFLIDAEGNIVQHKVGQMNVEQLRTDIKALLQTPATTTS